MIALATAFTAAVSAVQLLASERIRLNQELAKKRFVLQVMGIPIPKDATLQQVADTYKERVKETSRFIETATGRYPVLGGYNEKGELAGYAFEIAGRGFWDIIRGYLGIAPDLNSILGIAFYKQAETPGLGGEITKPWFRKQFEGKEIPREPAAGDKFVRLAPPGSEKGPHDVDAITGATQTSIAVEGFLNEDIKAFLETMREEEKAAQGAAKQG